MNLSPKILIIAGYTFEGTDATSITLKNIFSSWDQEKIAFIFITNPENNQVDNNHIFSIRNRKFGNFQLNKQKKNILNDIRTSKSVVSGVAGAISTNNKKTKFLNFLHTIISSHIAIIPYNYTKELDAFILKFQPDLIYSPLGEIGVMKLVNEVSRKHNLLVFPHFMDDWMKTKYAKNLFLIIPRIITNINIRKIFKRTEKAFAISEKMALQYSQQFNIPFYALMNCVEEPIKKSVFDSNDKTIRYCYSGGLHLNRWQSLVFLCESLSTAQKNVSIELSIFTKESDWQLYKNNFKKYSFVNYKGFIAQSEMLAELKNYTVLVHIESFDKIVLDYTRLSISTKIPEYLSMKKPILAIGPSDIASIEYLKNNNCAFIVDSKDEKLLNNTLNHILNQQLQKEIAHNAYFLYQKNHTKSAQQLILKNILIAE
jgi:hypothetical protein